MKKVLHEPNPSSPGISAKITARLPATLATTVTAALSALAPSIPPAIQRTIDQAQSALIQGRAAAAAELFEQAAEHGEFTEAEVGEVRARLWAGQFRHAVAISNTVAGEHPESAEAQALLAYIEDRSGYTAQALQRLHREREIHPHDEAPVAAEAEILIDRHRARDAINNIDRWIGANTPQHDVCRIRARAAVLARVDTGGAQAAVPVGGARSDSSGESPPGRNSCPGIATDGGTQSQGSEWPEAATSKPPATQVLPGSAGNGMIIDGGRHVVTLRELVDSRSASIWVRNARGELRRAQIEMRSADTALLSLNAPFAMDQSLPPESVTPQSARGLCFTLSFPASMSTDAMLPAVTPCFAFDPRAADAALRINIPLSQGERGSPVFDAEGRLMGLADPASGFQTRIVQTPKSLAAPSPTLKSQQTPLNHGAQPSIAMPELYERLAPAVVQVITYAPGK